jgi:hypothetical protein
MFRPSGRERKREFKLCSTLYKNSNFEKECSSHLEERERGDLNFVI